MLARPRSALALFLAVSSLAASSFAAAPLPSIDPNIERALVTGLVGPWQRTTPIPGRAPVLIELRAPATEASLDELEAAGVELTRVEGERLFYDRFVPATLRPASAANVAKLALIARVSLASGRGPLPLDQSAALIRLADARGARPAMDLLTGKGVTIADVDSLIDPFQPTFFKGDAGYFDWIDVDGDGVFTPGKDAIDLDRDGKAGPHEIGEWLAASTYSHGKEVEARSASFDPSIDWVYLDTNGNGKRDYGASQGFDDTTPALGEPLFVPDDVNRNGKVDAGERFVRLGTSKLKKVYVHIEYGNKVDKLFERGKSLSTMQTDYSHDMFYGYADALHATGVNTILVGDVPLVGRRWVGIAPEADVVLAWDIEYTQDGLPVKGLTWALKEKPDVTLHELAPWASSPLDGTDAMSALIDASTMKDHVTHTCPTGDQGSARKHAHADVAAGASATLAFEVPEKTKSGKGPLTYVDVAFNVRGGNPASLTLTSPTGEVVDPFQGAQGTFKGGAQWYATGQTTPRGTNYVEVILYAQTKGTSLDFGGWTAKIGGDPGAATSVDAYVADDKSSWAVGAGWDPAIATDKSTIGIPSVADHCIAVNAHPDHVVDPNAPWYDMFYKGYYDVPDGWVETQGQLRAYSPLGPRIDGVMKPDVTAPDNPWVAMENEASSTHPYGSFRVFGGTSGASPHVTGTAALLAQAGIKGDAARDAIRSGAVHDATTGAVPNSDYGYGRLDAAGALGAATKGGTPTVTLAFSPATPAVGDPVELTPAGGAQDGALEAKWDDDYDGVWDTPYAVLAPRKVTSTMVGKRAFKVRVRNAAGHIAEAVVWVPFAPPKPPPQIETPHDTPPAASSGCGCESVGRAPGGFGATLAAGLLMMAARRRRRSRER